MHGPDLTDPPDNSDRGSFLNAPEEVSVDTDKTRFDASGGRANEVRWADEGTTPDDRG